MGPQWQIEHFNVEERFSRFLKTLANSYYNRPEVSSYLQRHNNPTGSRSNDWKFHIKDICIVVQNQPFRRGTQYFTCCIDVYPNLTIDGALFPQYVKPDRSRRDNWSKQSEIALFKANHYSWSAPTDPNDDFKDETWQLLLVPDKPSAAASLTYCLTLTHKTTGAKYSIQVIVRRGTRPSSGDEVLEWKGFSLTRRQQVVYGRSTVARL
ncbi:hypothetical protein JCM3765_002069 [Sporobolomyces pararoseus]